MTDDEGTTDDAPVPRIEVEQHGAPIRRIDVDRAGRWLVTGSDDKTARVWALPEPGSTEPPRLVRVLRPPIGPGNEGKVYAMALSADGETVAVGGWDVSGPPNAVYLFERATGRIVRRLGGLENVVNHLTFSADGARLAAGLFANGLRVWRVADGTLLAADRGYGDSVYGVAFAADGRLATTSYDGQLRLYDADLRLIAKVPAPGGQKPYGIAFSPDGALLAVGYVDSTAVSVLSGTDLAPLFAADTRGIDTGNLGSVAWAADGTALFAGGIYPGGEDIRIVHWADGGRGKRTETAVARDTIIDLKPYGTSGVLFGAADPRFGAIDGDGTLLFARGPECADLRGTQGDAFTIAADGRAVRFGLGYGGERPVRFDLDRRTVTPDAPADPGLAPPRSAGLAIDGWEDTTAPTLAGKPLPLQPYESSRSLAIAPEGRRFLLGTEWSLRLFDADGEQLWQQPVPGVAWGVNITEDGGLALAAYGDGTVRWHRLEDGAKLLALFVHPDGQRWIAWTPEGYYDAAAGADELIGWHVNRGPDEAADFFPAARFRERFCRPDVIARVLTTLDVEDALAQADAARGQPAAEPPAIKSILPPVIEILSPADGQLVDQPALTLLYKVRSPSGALIDDVSALIDGRPATIASHTKESESGDIGRLTIALPMQSVSVSLLARTGTMTSEPATIRVRWRGTRDAHKPNLILLTVGISRYRSYTSLKYAHKDAEDFQALMLRQEGLLYRDVICRKAINEEAHRGAIVTALDWVVDQTRSNEDVAMVLFSGHGLNDRRRGFRFLPHDADLAALQASTVGRSDLVDTLGKVAGKVLFFIDCCHAGGAEVKGDVDVPDIDGLVNALKSAETGIIVFASSTGKQVSLEYPKGENGAFTEALIEGLMGEAYPDPERAITINGLSLWLGRRVPALTEKKQTPTTTIPKPISDFPIAVATGG